MQLRQDDELALRHCTMPGRGDLLCVWAGWGEEWWGGVEQRDIITISFFNMCMSQGRASAVVMMQVL